MPFSYWEIFVNMRKATILRATGHKSFAVKLSHHPGVMEIHCNEMNISDSRDFSDSMKHLVCQNITKRCTDISSIHKQGVEIDVELGEYCLDIRAFLHCSMRYPSIATMVEDESPFSQEPVDPAILCITGTDLKPSSLSISSSKIDTFVNSEELSLSLSTSGVL
jgi:hypothetical protein